MLININRSAFIHHEVCPTSCRNLYYRFLLTCNPSSSQLTVIMSVIFLHYTCPSIIYIRIKHKRKWDFCFLEMHPRSGKYNVDVIRATATPPQSCMQYGNALGSCLRMKIQISNYEEIIKIEINVNIPIGDFLIIINVEIISFCLFFFF